MDPKEKLKQVRTEIRLLSIKADLTDDEAKRLGDLMKEAIKLEAQITAQEADEAQRLKETTELEAKAKKNIEDAVKAALDKQAKEFAKTRRLPYGEGTASVAKFSELWKYDNLETGDMAVLAGVMKADVRTRDSVGNVLKALAIKLGEATKDGDVSRRRIGIMGANALKFEGIDALKADEIMQQDLTSHGDEWVGVAYSQALWETIRLGTFVVNSLPSIEVPPGAESYKMPIDAGDMTWYKVAETTDENATTKTPNASVPSSQVTTGNRTIALAKMGARAEFSGEFDEDSLIPVAAFIRQNMAVSGQEQMEHAVIDGDTAAGATTNINDIAGTPAGTEVFMLVDGFRKLALVTNTANKRDAGTLAAADYLETLKLMGLGGRNALADRSKIAFIVDLWTYWKTLELAEVKTKDVFTSPTIESGVLTGIFGVKLYSSGFMHFANQDATYGLKANSAGKTDLDTAANNVTGSILSVRWDRWMLGYRRRMTIESTRIPRADITEIVAMMRWGLINRDIEASAISYNITV